MTTTIRPWQALAAIGVGASIAAGFLIAFEAAADAQPTTPTSTAVGIAATGADPLPGQPSVSSAGPVKTGAAGSVRSGAGTVTASGLTVRAGAGIAEASVAGVSIGGRALGSVSARCSQGVTTVTHSGAPVSDGNLRVAYGSGGGPSAVGATITIIGADGKPAQTVTVASVSCAKAATQPPTTTPTVPPSSAEPTATPTSPPTVPPTSEPTTTTRPAAEPRPADPSPRQPAPQPTPIPGHHPVTG